MTRFVELTHADGNRPIIVNLDLITCVRAHENGTEITVGTMIHWVQEPYYYIKDMLIEKPKPVINHDFGSNPNTY